MAKRNRTLTRKYISSNTKDQDFKKICFVLMPFRDKLRNVYMDAIRPACNEANLKSLRVDELKGVYNINKKIIEYIFLSTAIIADLTTWNPNVFYELGVAHSIGNKTIMIINNKEDLPFDVSSYCCIQYEQTKKGLFYLKNKLVDMLACIEEWKNEPTNPVQDFKPLDTFVAKSAFDEVCKLLKEKERLLNRYVPESNFKILRKELDAKTEECSALKEELIKSSRVLTKNQINYKQGDFASNLKITSSGVYIFPSLTLLDTRKPAEKIDKDELMEKKQRIEEKLRELRVEGSVREYHPGPVVTTYEFFPTSRNKVSQLVSYEEDLSWALGSESVRIQRIPGKQSLGIEIPNNKREIISLRDILQSDKFINAPSKLTLALGKNASGDVYIADLASMPHLLIAGATGSGKSVALNAIITSILFKASPDEVKFILIDPKRLEFSLYKGIPHLLCPIITNPHKAGVVLMNAIHKMEERYKLLVNAKVRSIEQYNQQRKHLLKENKGRLTKEEAARLQPLPFIVIVIDELAELMMVNVQEMEYCLTRLAQLARPVGIHLVIATQQPSINVITGTIKNNFPSRIAFRVSSKIDSRIILDASGAEKLLGMGDMLFIPPNFPRLTRMHCAFISIPELRRLTMFVKKHGVPEYDDKFVKALERSRKHSDGEKGDKDEFYDAAVDLILHSGQASASYLQRRLKLGYARASRIIDQMESEGIIGASEGSRPREILANIKSYLADK